MRGREWMTMDKRRELMTVCIRGREWMTVWICHLRKWLLAPESQEIWYKHSLGYL